MLRPSLYIFGVLMMLCQIGPILAMVPISFSGTGFLSYPITEFSLRWYQRALAPEPWMAALQNSLIVATGTTVLASILGTLAALGLNQPSLRGKSALLALTIAPMIVPSVVTGVGLFFLLAKLGLNATYSGMILAHTVLATPFVVVTVSATLQTFDWTLVRAAYSLGAAPPRAFLTVILPNISAGLIAGAIFAFVTSLDEVIVALFISGPAQQTLPNQMFAGIRDNIDPSILAVSTLLILVTTALMIVVRLLSRPARPRRVKQA